MKRYLFAAIILSLLLGGCGKQTLPTADDEGDELLLYYPDPGTTVNGVRVYFDWKGFEENNGYRLLLWQDGELVLDQVEFQSSFKTLLPLYPGDYSWTVGMRTGTGEYDIWSDTISFTLEQKPYALRSTLQTQGEAQDLASFGDVIYVADNYSGLTVVDNSGVNPVLMGSYQVPDQDRARNLWIDALNTDIYVAGYRSSPPTSLFDIDNPLEPEYFHMSLWAYRSYDVTGFYKDEHTFLTVVDQDDGIFMFDVTEPTIAEGTRYTWYGTPYGVDAADNMLFAATGERGVAIYDITEPLDTATIALFNTPGDATDVMKHPSADYLYVADGLAGLLTVDISTPSSPVILDRSDTQVGDAQDIAIDGDMLYLCIGSKGVLIYDISIPESPYIIQQIETMYVNGVHAEDGMLYIADRDWGVVVMEGE